MQLFVTVFDCLQWHLSSPAQYTLSSAAGRWAAGWLADWLVAGVRCGQALCVVDLVATKRRCIITTQVDTQLPHKPPEELLRFEVEAADSNNHNISCHHCLFLKCSFCLCGKICVFHLSLTSVTYYWGLSQVFGPASPKERLRSITARRSLFFWLALVADFCFSGLHLLIYQGPLLQLADSRS